MDGSSPTETIDRASESVEQDQTARMCRLILTLTANLVHGRDQQVKGYVPLSQSMTRVL